MCVLQKHWWKNHVGRDARPKRTAARLTRAALHPIERHRAHGLRKTHRTTVEGRRTHMGLISGFDE
jgi:hypothetical protein